MEQKSPGLSKGCLIGIIIASSILFLIIVTVITCFVYRDDLAKWAATFTVDGLKGEAARNPEIVDTVRFNAFIDGFTARIKVDSLDKQKYADFMIAIQLLPKWIEDKKFDSSEVGIFSDALIAYFPDLEPLRPIAKEPAGTEPDSGAVPTIIDSSNRMLPPDTSGAK
jgi:hypothetical protein